MDQFVEHLRHLGLFADLSDEALRQIAGRLKRHRLKAGEVLFEKGSPGDSLYIVDTGAVKAFAVNTHGEEIVLNQFAAGESFGEMALIDQEPRSASVAALSDTDVLELERDAFLEVLAQNPTFSLDIMRDLTSKLRFAATYIQKATEWSQHIARGDYGTALGDVQAVRTTVGEVQSDDERAGNFLSAFFSMIEGVQAREEHLRQQVQNLQIEIDEHRKATMVAEITETDYFRDLQQRAKELRQNRSSAEGAS